MADYKDPRPSPAASAADPCVIYDNAVSLDKVINTDTTVTTYTGKEIKSLPMIVSDAESVADYLIDTLSNSFGIIYKGDFVDGFTITARNEAGFDGVDLWVYNLAIPELGLVVSAGFTPSTPNWTKITFASAYNVNWHGGKTIGYNADDWKGFTEALYAETGTVDNGLSDTAIASQRLDALKAAFDVYGTVADLAAGKFPVGKRVAVTDRANGVFLVQGSGVANGIDKLNAGGAKVAIIEFDLDSVMAEWVGFKAGDVDNSLVFSFCLSNLKSLNFGSSRYKIKSAVAATLSSDFNIIATAKGGLDIDILNGTLGTTVSINCAGYSLKTNGLVVSGLNKCAYPFYVYTNQESSGSVELLDSEFNDSYTTANFGNSGAYIRGGFSLVKSRSKYRNHNRALGAGDVGAASTNGLVVSFLNSFGVKDFQSDNEYFENITNSEVSGVANNTDCDGIKIFSNIASNKIRKTRVTMTSPNFVNCKGRAIKAQADIVKIISPTVYRNISGITGGSVEIDLQAGMGTVSSPTFIYEDSVSGEATLVRDITPLSIYNPVQLLSQRVLNSSDITVLDNTTGGGKLSSQLVIATTGVLSASFDTIINLTNVMSTAKADCIVACPTLTGAAKTIISVKNLYAKELTLGCFSFNSTANQVSNTKLSLDSVTNGGGSDVLPSYYIFTPTTKVPTTVTLESTSGLNASFSAGGASPISKISGVNEVGAQDGLTGMYTYSKTLADDASVAIPIPALFGIGVATVACNFNKSAIGMVTIDGSGAVAFGTVGSLFSAGGAVNADIDGSLNVWASGGVLNIKNRLGSQRVVTVSILG